MVQTAKNKNFAKCNLAQFLFVRLGLLSYNNPNTQH